MKGVYLLLGLVLGSYRPLGAQTAPLANDSNTPLHLLAPDYRIPYKEWNTGEIRERLGRILAYLNKTTPARVLDGRSRKEITDHAKIDRYAQVERGSFRLTSYEWGVTYSGMMAAADATGDPGYLEYVTMRFRFLSEMAPRFSRLAEAFPLSDGQMRQVISPGALDDAGAMCAAMIKMSRLQRDPDCRKMIDHYIDFIENKQYRLTDGTFARMRPQANTLWLDDMYMAIPAIAQMGAYTGEKRYFDEAARQVGLFARRMFVKEKGLFMHGWVESAADHPAFHWARANGWALLTLTELLDVLPKDHPERTDMLALYKAQVKGIAACQSGTGFWHQLLDRNDSYLETSATAIFVYCIARGINNGWLDAISFGPVAQLGWSAVATKINDKGQVEGTCVGTGMAFDPAYYYHRPVNVFAAHGYGPVLLAGAEMIRLLKKFHPRMNDSAIQYYLNRQDSPKPIFEVEQAGY
ncbi:glycoside hydrolase family 88/105 protein [Niabella aurantiaca]|uniref:glycoside hydrolase family 88/105 protein n=1 Tax=Niabella aurantiaca TaxID=379900 RepID=UPI0003759FA1|nr:glycoside hydrolase family 88 protein [Niabella aurantiaca]